MRFKEWMVWTEMGTSTSCIAGFSRMTLPLVTRMYPPAVMMFHDGEAGEEDEPVKKKRKRRSKKSDDA